MSGRHRGYSLIELMVILLLMAVFAAVANPVLRWSIHTLTTPPPATAAAQLDMAIGELRRDVWRAATLSTPSPHELTVVGLDGHSITWHVGPGDLLQRDDRRWIGLVHGATVAVDGAAVRLTLTGGPGYRGGVVTLASEPLLVGREP